MHHLVHAFIKRFGGAQAKQRVWNTEFSAGKWDYLDNAHPAARDFVLDVIEQYSEDGDILDLGCGSGGTGLEIRNIYRLYLGVDISQVAIQKAIDALQNSNDHTRKNDYIAADIATFVPPGTYSVIVFRESLYYFPLRTAAKLLVRYSAFLKPGGVFIVRIHDAQRHAK